MGITMKTSRRSARKTEMRDDATPENHSGFNVAHGLRDIVPSWFMKFLDQPTP